VASKWWDISTFCPATNVFQQQYNRQKYGRYLVGWVILWETEFSTVFYIVRSVLKFDYKLVINRTPNIWRLVESDKTLDFDRISVFCLKVSPGDNGIHQSLVAKTSPLSNDQYLLFRCIIDKNGAYRDKREFCKPASNQTAFRPFHFNLGKSLIRARKRVKIQTIFVTLLQNMV